MFQKEKNALLRFAANWGLIRMAEWLLAHGADINARDAYFLHSPLLLAVRRLDKKMTASFLHYGADPNLKDSWSISPLCWAFTSAVAKDDNWRESKKRLELMSLLIQHGALVNDPSSPIGAAIRNDDIDSVELLHNAGADWHLSLVFSDGKTAAKVLKEEGSPSMREKYLKFCEQK